MKVSWIFQLIINIGFLKLGSLVAAFLHVPLPGSVIGMILLFLSLLSGIIKLSWIERATSFQLKHITLLFIPPMVILFLSSSFQEIFHWYILIILIVSSICSLLGTAFFAEWHEKLKRRNEND
nr:CidA/LrgA family protein [Neobacillus sp. Marseille-Q6967]